MKHSTLTNPDDLHYAKVRTFTGDPAFVYPDFPDQLLVATDTNKVYRANWISEGAVTELVSSNANSAQVEFFPPINRPDKAGQFFYDQWEHELYISVANYFDVLWWKPVHRMQDFLSCSFVAQTSDETLNSSATFGLLYSEATPQEIEAGTFDFTRDVADNISLGNGVDLSSYLNSYGFGAYTIGYTVSNPNNLIVFSNLINQSTSVPLGFELRSSPNLVLANGQQTSNNYLYFYRKPPNEVLNIKVVISNIEIGG